MQMIGKPILYEDAVRLLTAFTEVNALRHHMSRAFTVDISMYASTVVDCLRSLQDLATL